MFRPHKRAASSSSTSSRSSGRTTDATTAATRSESSVDGTGDPVADPRVLSSRSAPRDDTTSTSARKTTKVLPVLHFDRPEEDENDDTKRVVDHPNQSSIDALHASDASSQHRPRHGKNDLHRQDHLRGAGPQLRSQHPKSAKRRVHHARSALLRATLRASTTTTVAATTRGRGGGSSYNNSDGRIVSNTEALQAPQPSSPRDEAISPRPAPRRNSRSLPAFSHHLAAALERLDVYPKRSSSAPAIRADHAWRYLLLTPSSPFWVAWNTLHLAALAYICTVVPYMTALPSTTFLEKACDWSETVNRAIDVFYICDVVVNFRACFVDAETGEVVTDARRVAMHYVKSSTVWFVFDVVMAFPFDLLLGGDAVGSNMTFTFVRILRLLRLAKLLRILKLRPLLDFCEDNLGVSRNKLIVVQLVATIAFVAHLTACGFVLAATVGPSVVSAASTSSSASSALPAFSHTRSWIGVNGLSDAPSGEIYVAALYWAFTMMTTVGFGDIVPVTLAERVYSILAMVISAGTYAYVIASMSTIVALMNLQQSRYYERINELNAYMASRQLPPGLQLRTRQFFRYYLMKKTVFDEHALFDVLPQNLREELVEHHVKTAMHHIAFFHELTERGFIGHIALFLRPAFFPPSSVIVEADDHAAEMFFISKGSFHVFIGSPTTTTSVSPQHSPTRRLRANRFKPSISSIAQYLSPRRSSTAVDLDADSDRLVASLRDGDFFGEMALLCDAPRHRRLASVRSVTYCELHSLSYAQLTPALDKYLSVWKQMHVAAQERLVVLEDLRKTKIDHALLAHGSTNGPATTHLPT